MPTKLKKESLTQAQVKEICDAAESAWRDASPTATKVTFYWNGHKLRSGLNTLRMYVDTIDGTPLVARFH
jgi:hypothetical protein